MAAYNTPKNDGAHVELFVYRNALKLRERCKEAMADPELAEYEVDPGDAQITINGNDHNACRVLGYLAAIGVPGCET